MNAIGDEVLAACEKHWPTYKGDCSGLVKAVASELGIILSGQANDIVDQIQKVPWEVLSSGVEASKKVHTGVVIAGLQAPLNGHVAVVVPGDLAQGKYPTGYWGRLGGVGKQKATLNWSWNAASRDKVVYSWHQL
jgi:hypothetical protein